MKQCHAIGREHSKKFHDSKFKASLKRIQLLREKKRACHQYMPVCASSEDSGHFRSIRSWRFEVEMTLHGSRVLRPKKVGINPETSLR